MPQMSWWETASDNIVDFVAKGMAACLMLGFAGHLFVFMNDEAAAHGPGNRFKDDNAYGATANAVQQIRREAPSGIVQKVIAVTLLILVPYVVNCHATLRRLEIIQHLLLRESRAAVGRAQTDNTQPISAPPIRI